MSCALQVTDAVIAAGSRSDKNMRFSFWFTVFFVFIPIVFILIVFYNYRFRTAKFAIKSENCKSL